MTYNEQLQLRELLKINVDLLKKSLQIDKDINYIEKAVKKFESGNAAYLQKPCVQKRINKIVKHG
jgi:hypothetical protein